MKAILAFTLMVASSIFAQKSSEVTAKPLQAQVTRSTTGRTLGPNGLAIGTMPLKKGMIYPVVEQKMGYVVMDAGGGKVVVPQSDVTLSEMTAPPPTAAVPGQFQPGQVVLISARYTVEGNQPRNVKNRLDKLIPKGLITEPISIMVTDALSSLAESQSGVITGVVTDTPSGAVVQLQGSRKNILTVEYSFNGQVRKKQVPEGAYLTLP